ncbi:DUF418 domain-containing protein [Nonomuraea sp. 10N515B]|uniref:DUF418 domain-containing protein n=1 Tax=Nonomuraea sp. 10N515B TaxID=3457422 RepID=UPI003FCD109E
MLMIAGGILAVQWLWSTLWLRRYRQSPLEWLWRWATWGRRPPPCTSLNKRGRTDYAVVRKEWAARPGPPTTKPAA